MITFRRAHRARPAREHTSGDPETFYRVHVGPTIYGPITVGDFRRIPGFTLKTPVAPFGTEAWRPAYQVIDLQKYFHREVVNSFTQAAALETIQGDALGTPAARVAVFRPIRQILPSKSTLKRAFAGTLAASVILGLALALPHWVRSSHVPSIQLPSVSTADLGGKLDRFLSNVEP